MPVKELAEKRGPIVKQIRDLADLVEKENRTLTAEEKEKYDSLNEEYDRLTGQLEIAQRAESLQTVMDSPLGDDIDDHIPHPQDTDDEPNEDRVTCSVLREWRNHPDYAATIGNRGKPEYRAAFNRWLSAGPQGLRSEEYRALQADLDVSGGYLAAGEQFVADLIKAVDDMVVVRGLARIFRVTQAESLGAPALDNDPADATWTAEIATGAEDSTMSFGKRNLHPHPLAQRIKVSRTLLRRAVIGVEALVRDRLAYKFGVVEDNAFLNGTGANQPLGVFVAAAGGIGTGQDVNVGSTSDVTADGFIKTVYKLKPAHIANSTWILHRDVVRNARLLKDGEGRYIWNSGLATDRPDTIVDRPYVMSEYAPNTFSSANYIGILGDWQFYWIADALQMELQRLDELYAATNQIGFIGRKETDGMPVLESAFARMKLSA